MSYTTVSGQPVTLTVLASTQGLSKPRMADIG